MPDNPLLQWTLDAKRALQQAEQLSSHANNLVRDSAASLDTAESLEPKCVFLSDALRGQVGLLERLGQGCYAVEEHARREFEVCFPASVGMGVGVLWLWLWERFLDGVINGRCLSRSWIRWISS